MKMAKHIIAVMMMVMVAGMFTPLFSEINATSFIPEKCTAIYVGKNVSEDGTTIISRSEDQMCGAWGKTFYVVPASDKGSGEITETGVDNTLTVKIPKKTYKYTALADEEGHGIGPYYGMHEAILAAVPACQCETAEDAVKTIAHYVDRYGSSECNTILLSDKYVQTCN